MVEDLRRVRIHGSDHRRSELELCETKETLPVGNRWVTLTDTDHGKRKSVTCSVIYQFDFFQR
jgi:hypothetical protein